MRQRQHIGYIMRTRRDRKSKWSPEQGSFVTGTHRYRRDDCLAKATAYLNTTTDRLTIRILKGTAQIVRVFV